MTGETIDDELITSYLGTAIATLEMTGLTISPTNFTKQEDFHDGMLGSRYFSVIVDRYPVLDVQDMTLCFPHTTNDKAQYKYVIPKTWLSWEKNKINLIASTGLLAPQMSGPVLNAPLAIWSNAPYRPNAFTVTWQAGFEPDKLPYLLWKLLVDMATFDLLVDVGPMLFPVGSMSVGIDGVSQSSQTPGPQLLTSRLKDLEKRIDKQKATITAFYGQTIAMDFMGL
jgi:hypothetical protein